MKHAFHPEAFAEYVAAASAYEDGQPGLGARFIQSVESAIEGICQAPERWTILEQDVRRRLTRVFPYAILYVIEENHLLIVAVMHCHRKPGYWRTRAVASPTG
jgi:plasmid stabilization system protein ParE